MPPLKFDRNAQLAKARTILAETGQSPRELSQNNLIAAVKWTYRWGVTSTPILSAWMEKSSGAAVKRLIERGWLNSTKTRSGIPPSFITLSQLGLDEATKYVDILLPYPELDPFRVKQDMLRHSLLTQRLTIKELDNSRIIHFETEREIAIRGDQRNTKRPDAIWLERTGSPDRAGTRFGVEVELSGKWSRDLDDFVFGIILALSEAGGKHRQLDRFIIYSDSEAILERYEQAMAPGSPLNIWKKNGRGHWAVIEEIKVPEWLARHVEFRKIED
jgi:hypothetical protein